MVRRPFHDAAHRNVKWPAQRPKYFLELVETLAVFADMEHSESAASQ
jgi:hypothetical protein